MVLPEKLTYLLTLVVFGGTIYAVIKGYIDKEDLKKLVAKFLFGAFLAAFIVDPKLFINLGKMLASIVFGAGELLGTDTTWGD